MSSHVFAFASGSSENGPTLTRWARNPIHPKPSAIAEPAKRTRRQGLRRNATARKKRQRERGWRRCQGSPARSATSTSRVRKRKVSCASCCSRVRRPSGVTSRVKSSRSDCQ